MVEQTHSGLRHFLHRPAFLEHTQLRLPKLLKLPSYLTPGAEELVKTQWAGGIFACTGVAIGIGAATNRILLIASTVPESPIKLPVPEYDSLVEVTKGNILGCASVVAIGAATYFIAGVYRSRISSD